MVQVSELVIEHTSLLPPQRSECVQALHQFIVKLFSLAQLFLKYKIPTYEVDSGWVAVASQKNYVSACICAREHIQPYIDIHSKITCGTGCLNFRDSDDFAWAGLEPVLRSTFRKDH